MHVQAYGLSEVYTNVNNQERQNKMEWKGDMSGKAADVDLSLEQDGARKVVHMKLTKEDFMDLLKNPSDFTDLEDRLKRDFPHHKAIVKRIQTKSKSTKRSKTKSEVNKSNRKKKKGDQKKTATKRGTTRKTRRNLKK